MIRPLTILAAAVLAALPATARAIDPEAFSWPTPTKESRPWTRWWWLGSAVDNANLTPQLEQLHAAGLGGVEICPIYGAKGYESRYLPFLSPQWMAALAHTTREANRLGMGVDLTTGTGWPFGGPQVTKADASTKFTLQKSTPGQSAGSGSDRSAAPDSSSPQFTLSAKSPIQKVKRAAPGGEGSVLDPYSPAAMGHYLQRFNDAFKTFDAPLPRAHFHDSFEYYGANWTPDLFTQFQKLRGYDLHDHLAELAGNGDADTVARVKHDYRETIADLHLAYLKTWSDFAHAHHGLARNQAHGSPTNLLDAYAAADIPETEIFGPPTHRDNNPLFLKFASSAAHVAGHNLASSESFTWLGEHFQVSLADCKPAADLLFISGINHVFFHGTPYSPSDVPFPGWLFYASVNFGPQGGIFHDLPAFTGYLTRVQSVLQEGQPDTDFLLYFPVHDLWQTTGKDPLVPLAVHNQSTWLTGTPFHQIASDLIAQGYTVDYVSDRLLQSADIKSRCRAIVVPPCKFMPPETAQRLADLSKSGLPVIFRGPVPTDVPGLANLDQRRAALKSALAQLATGNSQLATLNIPRETLVDTGLRFVRRSYARGHHYFLSNPTDKPFDGWLPLATPAAAAVLLDPMAEDHIGTAALRHRPDSHEAEVYVQLPPGGSIIVRTFADTQPSGPEWRYYSPTGKPVPVEGTWKVTFVDGGPALPQGFTTNALASWTNQDDPEAKRFAGTGRYSIDFETPNVRCSDFLLDLGRVCDSARVSLNGHPLPTLWSPPYSLPVGPYLAPQGSNHLEVEVTNVAANRIADLDRRGVQWKAFHEINFVNKDYKPFDASKWPLRDSGLLGPVRLVPLKQFNPNPENH